MERSPLLCLDVPPAFSNAAPFSDLAAHLKRGVALCHPRGEEAPSSGHAACEVMAWYLAVGKCRARKPLGPVYVCGSPLSFHLRFVVTKVKFETESCKRAYVRLFLDCAQFYAGATHVLFLSYAWGPFHAWYREYYQMIWGRGMKIAVL